MKPLYSQEEYDSSKSTAKLPLECYHCGKTFQVEKRFIKSELKRRISSKKYCNKKCFALSKITSVVKPCALCNKEVVRKLGEFKSSKNGNVFCSLSCAAKYNNTHKTKGTRRSKLEIWMESTLPPLYPNLIFKFNDKETINSELDIYIPSLNIAFELQGIFHFQPIYGVRKLAQIQANDYNKAQLCCVNGIDLVTIDVSAQKIFTAANSQKYLDIVCDQINIKLNQGK